MGEEDATLQVPVAGSSAGIVGALLASRYRIESKLGEGGMASVYLATDQRVDRQVVVKVPHARLLETPGFLERFRRELRSLIQVEHPNVVQLYDLGEHDGVPFAVAQYLRGGNLADRIAQAGRQTPEEVLRWLAPAARALDSIHASGFVHRDVKPDNILFDQHGNVFVSDFGIAKALPGSETTQSTQLTQVGYFVGSPAYAPPEALDEHLSPAYDQYSLGVAVYEALCGRKPFEAASLQALLRDKATGQPAPVAASAALPRPAERALLRALAREPGERFPSCREFAEAFAAGLSQAPARWPWAAAAALALALGGVWLWSAREPSPGPVPEPSAATAQESAAGTPSPAAGAAPDTLSPPAPPAAAAEAAPSAPAAASGLVHFRAGSSEAEIRNALALCARYETECDPEWYADETLREVDLRPVLLDTTEVTNAEFAAFVASQSYVTTAEQQGFSYDGSLRVGHLSWRNPEGGRSSEEQQPEHPVVHVSAADAAAYCAWRGRRLPSEDEWELAARGSQRRVFPWGDDWDESRAVWRASAGSGPAAVGSRPLGATPDGHLDLAGNVWEWTSTASGDGRILKGGSWREDNPANLRSAARLLEDAQETNSDIGFRCAGDAAAAD